MKKIIFISLLLGLNPPLILAADKNPSWKSTAGKTSAASKDSHLSLGFIAGSPTGLSLKYRTSQSHAFGMGLGLPVDSDVRFHVHADSLWHVTLNENPKGELPFYMGIGARLQVIDRGARKDDGVDLGLRIPLGMEFLPNAVPLAVFAEVVPVIILTSGSRLGLDGGVGIRYHFR